MYRLVIFILILVFSKPSLSQDYLVDGAWVKNNLGIENLFILDIQQADFYQNYHIPGAINAPYDLWRTGKNISPPGMLPSINDMERFLGNLGISNKDKIIIVSTGTLPGDMAASARVFWTLKIMGLAQISVLNGGLASYANIHGGSIERKSQVRAPAIFKARPDKSIVADTAYVQTAVNSKFQLLDARTLGEYLGVITARPNERPGTLPGAKHLPFDWLVDISGSIRDKKTIITLFEKSNLDPKQDGSIHFCHTGNRAALSWFVDYAILGNKNARLYDASMSEWAVSKDLPIELKIDLTK